MKNKRLIMEYKCNSQFQAQFKMQQSTIYMQDSKGEWQVISSVQGDIWGAYPPTDYEIQNSKCGLFKTYGLPYDSSTMATIIEKNEKAFQTHSGFLSQGDGQTFIVNVCTNFPKVIEVDFIIKQGQYFTNLNSSSYYSLGYVAHDGGGNVLPIPDSALPKGYIKAPGKAETVNNNALFALHGQYTSSPEPGDGKVFTVHLMYVSS